MECISYDENDIHCLPYISYIYIHSSYLESLSRDKYSMIYYGTPGDIMYYLMRYVNWEIVFFVKLFYVNN